MQENDGTLNPDGTMKSYDDWMKDQLISELRLRDQQNHQVGELKPELRLTAEYESMAISLVLEDPDLEDLEAVLHKIDYWLQLPYQLKFRNTSG